MSITEIAVSLLFGATMSLTAAAISYFLLARMKLKSAGETLEDRIERYLSAVRDAARAIDEIDGAIEERRKVVEELQEDKTKYDSLLELSASEVEAVMQSLSVPIKKEAKKSRMLSIVIGISSFILGSCVTALAALLIA